jgi:hypothetical protein
MRSDSWAAPYRRRRSRNIKASLERLAGEFEELGHGDARLPLAQRDGCSAILAVRSWEFSEVARLRRVGSLRGPARRIAQ